MQFQDHHNPTEDELRAWAAQEIAPPPVKDWESVLAWGMDPTRLGLCVELAAGSTSPAATFFLLVLYQWVDVVARDERFASRRAMYDKWLDAARGTKDPAIKRWRDRARFVFQGAPFNREHWWAAWSAEQSPA